MEKENQELARIGRKIQSPSEKTARFILGICSWVKDIFTAPMTTIPRGQVLHHQGVNLPPGKRLRFVHILLVEDNPDTAHKFIATLEKHYVFGAIRILVAHAYDAAVTFFENEDIDLVIMDADLDDEDGDGATLTQNFVAARPGIPILANSSSKVSNLKLTGFGAVDTLGKNTEKLQSWLLQNDPTGIQG